MNKTLNHKKTICIYKQLKMIRNLEAERFTASMTTDQSLAVKAGIQEQIPYIDALKKYQLTEINLGNRLTQQQFMSEGILYVDPLKSNLSVGLMASREGHFYFCINDLDHMRLSLMSYEDSFDDIWQSLDLMDDGLGQSMELAFLEPFGYLTSRIEQLGTGLNGEAMLHLPALKKTGFINALAESMGAIGVQIKPFRSDFYTILNTVTLGRSEVELVLLLDQVVEKLSERESAGRETLWVSEYLKTKDQIGKAYGHCQYATLAEEEEAIQWISDLMLGESYDLIESVYSDQETAAKWHDYLKRIRDSHIELVAQKNLGYREKMQKRGEILNEIHKHWCWRG